MEGKPSTADGTSIAQIASAIDVKNFFVEPRPVLIYNAAFPGAAVNYLTVSKVRGKVGITKQVRKIFLSAPFLPQHTG